MSSRGYIKLYRSVLKHPFFRNDEERVAWFWLLCEAAWKPYRKRAGEFFVDLERAEVVGAVRYLADEWGWSRGKVERFIIRLKNEEMVETRTETGITIITICNYIKFQGGEDDGETVMDTEPRQSRDAGGTRPRRRRDAGGDNKKEIKHLTPSKREEDETITDDRTLFDTGLVPSSQPLNTDEQFQQWYTAYPKKADPKDARKSFDRVLKNQEATFEQLLAGAQRYAAETSAAGTAKNFIKAPAVWLNKGSWANEAGAYAPAPPPVSRSGSFMDGLAASLSREDFDERNR